MACCVTCHKRVLVAVTGRGRLLPLSLQLRSGPLAVRRGATPGLPTVRYLRGAAAQLEDGERLMTCHWDVSPACKPPRKGRKPGRGLTPGQMQELLELSREGEPA